MTAMRSAIGPALPGLAALLVVAVGLTLAASPAGAILMREGCENTVSKELQKLGIDPATTESISLIEDLQTFGGGGERVVGVTAWIRFPGKKGTLAIVMNRHCSVQTMFTRGEVEIEGVTR